MQTGTKISAAGHGAVIVLAMVGLPWFGPSERDPIKVTEVSFVSEAEFAAAQSAAPDVPREPEAPAELPAPRPPRPAPVAKVEPEAAEPDSPEEEVATLQAPEPERVSPKVVTLDPPTAAAPPRARPVPRVDPNPTPPIETPRPAETPKPVKAPSPKVVEVTPEEPPAAPPEAAPETSPEPAPPATLALETSSRPLARPEKPARSDAETVMTALKREVTKEVKRRATPSAATSPTEPTVSKPTPPTPPSTSTSSATSLPVGPPMTGAEKDGLKLAVQRCWNVPAGLRDAQELKVTLAAKLNADGSVITGSIRMIEPSPAPDGRFQQAYEAGRRALIRCAPYSDLPRDKFAQWQDIEVVFNPEGMVSW